jgi:hypothetical protein
VAESDTESGGATTPTKSVRALRSRKSTQSTLPANESSNPEGNTDEDEVEDEGGPTLFHRKPPLVAENPSSDDLAGYSD